MSMTYLEGARSYRRTKEEEEEEEEIHRGLEAGSE